jgi:voltage-gated potassium channel
MDERSERVAERFEVPMLIAALLVIPDLAIQQSDLSQGWQTAADVLDWMIWGAFLVELVVMLWVVPRRWWYLRHRPLDLVIVVFTFPVLPSVLAWLRVLRLSRLLRLLRLAPLLRSAQLARQVFSLQGVKYAALLTLLTVLVGGAAFANTEGLSDWQGIYWAVTTATTVGYGTPAVTTTTGEVIAVLVMLVSIGFAAVITGALAERFVAGGEARRAEDQGVALAAEELDILEQIADVQARITRLERDVRARLGPPPS